MSKFLNYERELTQSQMLYSWMHLTINKPHLTLAVKQKYVEAWHIACENIIKSGLDAENEAMVDSWFYERRK